MSSSAAHLGSRVPESSLPHWQSITSTSQVQQVQLRRRSPSPGILYHQHYSRSPTPSNPHISSTPPLPQDEQKHHYGNLYQGQGASQVSDILQHVRNKSPTRRTSEGFPQYFPPPPLPPPPPLGSSSSQRPPVLHKPPSGPLSQSSGAVQRHSTSLPSVWSSTSGTAAQQSSSAAPIRGLRRMDSTDSYSSEEEGASRGGGTASRSVVGDGDRNRETSGMSQMTALKAALQKSQRRLRHLERPGKRTESLIHSLGEPPGLSLSLERIQKENEKHGGSCSIPHHWDYFQKCFAHLKVLERYVSGFVKVKKICEEQRAIIEVFESILQLKENVEAEKERGWNSKMDLGEREREGHEQEIEMLKHEHAAEIEALKASFQQELELQRAEWERERQWKLDIAAREDQELSEQTRRERAAATAKLLLLLEEVGIPSKKPSQKKKKKRGSKRRHQRVEEEGTIAPGSWAESSTSTAQPYQSFTSAPGSSRGSVFSGGSAREASYLGEEGVEEDINQKIRKIPLEELMECVQNGADVLFRAKEMTHSMLSMFIRGGHIEHVRYCLCSPFLIDFTATSSEDGFNTPLHYMVPTHTPVKTRILLELLLDRLETFDGYHSEEEETSEEDSESSSSSSSSGMSGKESKNNENQRQKGSQRAKKNDWSLFNVDGKRRKVDGKIDKIDWGQKNQEGNDFLSMAACGGKLSLVWEILKRRKVDYFMNFVGPFPPLTFRVFQKDWQALSYEDRRRFQPAMGFL